VADEPVRWGILGTANIARAQFLPGLREAGRGRPVAVGGRDRDRAEAYARANGVARAIVGYQELLDDPDIDAVYNALPNSLHGEWTIKALAAGKAVLCEKPLTASVAETAEVLDAAVRSPAPLWEAFVFPFQAQHARLVELLGDGAVGELREIYGAFHFSLTRPENIRWDAELGGGALYDVGCYPVRLAGELFGADAERGQAYAQLQNGVDVDTTAMLDYPGGRRLALTCGFHRPYDTFARLLGSEGFVHVANPYHPSVEDTIEIHRAGHDVAVERPTTDQHTFTAAIRHIHDVLIDGADPRQTAVETSMRCAQGLDLLVQSLG